MALPTVRRALGGRYATCGHEAPLNVVEELARHSLLNVRRVEVQEDELQATGWSTGTSFPAQSWSEKCS